jgi:DNA topoisomerase II
MMRGENIQPLLPWYKGFLGTFEKSTKGFTVTGVCQRLSNTQLQITELPIGKWTRDYKTFLEELAQKEEIEDIAEHHTENRVHFVITS